MKTPASAFVLLSASPACLCLSAMLIRKFDEFNPIRCLPELKITEFKFVVLITSPCSHLGADEPPHSLLEGCWRVEGYLFSKRLPACHGYFTSVTSTASAALDLLPLPLPLPLRNFRDAFNLSLDWANWLSWIMLYVLWRSFVR